MKRPLSLLIGAALLTGCQATTPPKTYVFVHGAYGGAHDWLEVERLVEAAGHRARRVCLTGLGERAHLATPQVNLTTHITDVTHALRFDDLHNVVLVGHSYGGNVITGAAHRVPGRIALLVYLDASLPLEGEAVADRNPAWHRHGAELARERGDGWRIPPTWSGTKDVAHPLATLTEPIRLGNPEAESIPGVYVLFQMPDAEPNHRVRYAERAEARGWPTYTLESGHNPQRTRPKALAALLLKVTGG